MSASVRWDGLDELRAALRNLPADLTAEASHIVEGTANSAEVDMRAEYPAGELRDKLSQAVMSLGPLGTGIRLKNASGWAWLWDHGSKLRHTTKGKPTGAEWGKTAPPHTFGRVMAQSRRRMYEQLMSMLVSYGLVVSGEP
jgi:hypothetical protein